MTEKSSVVQMHEYLLKNRRVQAGVFSALLTVHANTFGQKYKHYKGSVYWALGTGLNTETVGEVVIYMNQSGHLFTRPVSEFFELVDSENKIQRFTLVEV